MAVQELMDKAQSARKRSTAKPKREKKKESSLSGQTYGPSNMLAHIGALIGSQLGGAVLGKALLRRHTIVGQLEQEAILSDVLGGSVVETRRKVKEILATKPGLKSEREGLTKCRVITKEERDEGDNLRVFTIVLFKDPLGEYTEDGVQQGEGSGWWGCADWELEKQSFEEVTKDYQSETVGKARDSCTGGCMTPSFEDTPTSPTLHIGPYWTQHTRVRRAGP